MDEIIMDWMEQQRQHRNDDGTIFFQVSFRDLFEEWHEFVQGKYERPIRHTNIIAAEDAACTNSIHRLNTLTKVHMGLIVLSLWSDGVCLYRNPISDEYIGQDYSDVWHSGIRRKKR
jgi:hypothetical protein